MDNPLLLLLLFLTIAGAAGVYVTLPGSRLGWRSAGHLLVAAAGAGLIGLTTNLVAGARNWVWFLAFGLIGLWAAVRVITHVRPVYSALYFVLLVVCVGGELVLMSAGFLAAALLIIYAGAILVTYMFVIMLAQQGTAATYDRQSCEPLIGAATGFALLGVVLAALFATLEQTSTAQSDSAAQASGSVAAVGTHLLTQHVVGIELAGLLLLAAMVGAIAIARRKPAAHDMEGGR